VPCCGGWPAVGRVAAMQVARLTAGTKEA